MRVLVWQWGRRGGGPRFAASLAEAFRRDPGIDVTLSLARDAELLRGCAPPPCELPTDTYGGALELIRRLAVAPLEIARLKRRLAPLQLDLAICAMPGPLDPLVVSALRRLGVPVAVVVHDADTHPGDHVPLLLALQRHLIRRADAVISLSGFVASRLRTQGLMPDGARLFIAPHPPFKFGGLPPPPREHGGAWRVLSFGRLRRYKGLDLLADAVRRLGAQTGIELRVVGAGPETSALAALRALPGVTVENRWVNEEEVGSLLAWSDALVLPYREASQSGVAPTALAAGRFVLANRVGGLVEQLDGHPRAILCDPSVDGLESGLRQLIDASPATVPPSSDPDVAWSDMADSILRHVASLRGRPGTPGSLRRLPPTPLRRPSTDGSSV